VAGRPADHLSEREPPAGGELAVRLGGRLRERRLALGRTLADVAREADLSTSYLSAVEHGSNMPSLPVLARLVHALRLTLHELLRDEDRTHLRTGDLPDAPGAQELDHPQLRLRVSALVSRPGESGVAPVPIAHATVFVFVERGALLVEVDGTPFALGQGDALDAVDVGDIRWESLGEVAAVSVWGASRARSLSVRDA
jgi:transcriptional regulator with XRE-family HTH domain